MAWIESHQDLRDHPKTKRLARILGINRAEAIGWLQMLWWWALDYAEDGDLSRYDDADIEDGVDWSREPTTFVSALSESGFLSDDRHIHDWSDYAGRLVERRSAERERSRARRTNTNKERPAANLAASSGQPADVGRSTAGTNQPDQPTKPTGPDQPDQPDQPGGAADAVTGTDGPSLGWEFKFSDLSEGSREFLDAFRVSYGKRSPPKLNREQVRQVEAAVLDLGVERLTEAAAWAAGQGIDYGGGGIVKTVRGARTKRQRDEGETPERRRNGRSGKPGGDDQNDQFAHFRNIDAASARAATARASAVT